ncbi:Rieske (2Fe-2S) protein [Candidatus Korarchaeum cryptofilum]|uniref:Rieske (2Fe-2S) domain protein n=1 Tax=Korarchaeum cryptofilum (strain OPF8) TaxID=374847 RepID=B1L634_KORCO|nr:Rieske 2Fe-2S domain-containing protein [Candidatus Korarchaeum cryptofilum]ACB07913.1 Rieske (2Fe-2S) domain protein [Candidatus Korarchaeum cryptofilum OPF8]
MVEMTRRDFIKASVVTSVALAAASLGIPLVQYISSERVVTGKIGAGSSSLPLKIANINDLEPDSQMQFTMPLNPDGSRGQHPTILIRLRPELVQKAGTELKAFSAVCTHLGCIVHLEKKDDIYCPCHAGYFDPVTGEVLAGPPKKPLPEVKIRIDENGDIYAEGWKK